MHKHIAPFVFYPRQAMKIPERVGRALRSVSPNCRLTARSKYLTGRLSLIRRVEILSDNRVFRCCLSLFYEARRRRPHNGVLTTESSRVPFGHGRWFANMPGRKARPKSTDWYNTCHIGDKIVPFRDFKECLQSLHDVAP